MGDGNTFAIERESIMLGAASAAERDSKYQTFPGEKCQLFGGTSMRGKMLLYFHK